MKELRKKIDSMQTEISTAKTEALDAKTGLSKGVKKTREILKTDKEERRIPISLDNNGLGQL
mgnify:CR=1 FL=1